MNADQSMPEGGELEITAKNVRVPGTGIPGGLQPGKYVEISIKDTGTGIEKDKLELIFRRFYHGADSTGLGLGLAIVKHVVTQAGGYVEAHGGRGHGFEVRCDFPPPG